MLPNVQRAKVESKSQLKAQAELAKTRCYQMYKELKLKANHNYPLPPTGLCHDVTKCTKS